MKVKPELRLGISVDCSACKHWLELIRVSWSCSSCLLARKGWGHWELLVPTPGLSRDFTLHSCNCWETMVHSGQRKLDLVRKFPLTSIHLFFNEGEKKKKTTSNQQKTHTPQHKNQNQKNKNHTHTKSHTQKNKKPPHTTNKNHQTL